MKAFADRLARQNNSRHLEGGTEEGIQYSYEEGFQDGDGITPSSKSVMMVLQKEEGKLKAIQRTEEVLIDKYGGREEQDPLKENKLILHHPSHADLCNDTECERNEKVMNIHEGSASVNVRKIEPVFSPDKEKGGPLSCTAGTEHALFRSPDTRPLDNKNGGVEKARVTIELIVTPEAMGKKPADIISSIETFN